MRLTKEVITTVLSFIDAASSRGAIRGDELSLVGELRKYFVEYGSWLINEEKQSQQVVSASQLEKPQSNTLNVDTSSKPEE